LPSAMVNICTPLPQGQVLHLDFTVACPIASHPRVLFALIDSFPQPRVLQHDIITSPCRVRCRVESFTSPSPPSRRDLPTRTYSSPVSIPSHYDVSFIRLDRAVSEVASSPSNPQVLFARIDSFPQRPVLDHDFTASRAMSRRVLATRESSSPASILPQMKSSYLHHITSDIASSSCHP
jgi:hypothetical protein